MCYMHMRFDNIFLSLQRGMLSFLSFLLCAKGGALGLPDLANPLCAERLRSNELVIRNELDDYSNRRYSLYNSLVLRLGLDEL